ncbi:MAG: endonuclease/exonuclease/phosphatase family protein [Parvicellaceae bacterium]
MRNLSPIKFNYWLALKNISLSIFCLFILIPFNTKASESNDTIQIVSWNIQMLPDIFAPFSKRLRKKQKIRCPKIIQYLNASDFDIVILQEVFDKQRVNELEDGLKVIYPHILRPIKEGASLKLSSGVMILSKYPTELIDHVIFGVSKKSDWGAQKGCSLIKVKINNRSILVGGTHLDSKSEVSRNMQYHITKEQIIKPYFNDSVPMFLAGDFNTIKSSKDYEKMITLFDLENYELDDERPYTFDEYNSWNSKGYKSWIDFIFYQKTEKIKITDQNIFRPKMQYEKSTIDLADHYQIVLEAVIY